MIMNWIFRLNPTKRLIYEQVGKLYKFNIFRYLYSLIGNFGSRIMNATDLAQTRQTWPGSNILFIFSISLFHLFTSDLDKRFFWRYSTCFSLFFFLCALQDGNIFGGYCCRMACKEPMIMSIFSMLDQLFHDCLSILFCGFLVYKLSRHCWTFHQ